MFKRWQWWVCSPLIMSLLLSVILTKTLGFTLCYVGEKLSNIFEGSPPKILIRLEKFIKG